MIACFTSASERIRELVVQQFLSWGRKINPRRIVIKPNWVIHETDPAFPIAALVTDSRLIEATAEACLEIFPNAESIIVGDCPLQYADWPLLCNQSGLTPIIERLSKISNGKIAFYDLRKDVFRKDEDNFLEASGAEHGDPAGYQEVELGTKSHLESISHQSKRFAVNDYSSSVTSSNHTPGSHRYFVSQTVLNADLIINLPKWKAHQKSGITCALKNLVGINSDKAYLPHFRKGAPKWGGDEYRDENRWLYLAQTRLRENLQKRSRIAYKALKPGWELLKRLRGIETRLDNREAKPKNFYVAGGSWYGNDTIWRMIYDLNLIVQCTDNQGRLQLNPQRHYYCIVDGLISGEGNGPLQPLPKETDWLAFGEDPFEIDAALSWFMGFRPEKIPIIAHRQQYAGLGWGCFELDRLTVEMDGREIRLLDSDTNFKFVPPPGWRNYVER